MDAPRSQREVDAARLKELNAEIERVWPNLREGHVPTAFRKLCDALPEAVAAARRLDLAEEAARFEARLEEARKVALVELSTCAARAEGAVERMYDSRDPAGPYSEAKDLFGDAIGLATRLGLKDEAAKFSKRLAEVKAAFRGPMR